MTVENVLHHTCNRCGNPIDRSGTHGWVAHAIHDRERGYQRGHFDLCEQCCADYSLFLKRIRVPKDFVQEAGS